MVAEEEEVKEVESGTVRREDKDGRTNRTGKAAAARRDPGNLNLRQGGGGVIASTTIGEEEEEEEVAEVGWRRRWRENTGLSSRTCPPLSVGTTSSSFCSKPATFN